MQGSRLLKLGTIWIIVTLAPTSSIMPLNDLAVEHRLYLPMALGFCPIFVLTVSSIQNPFQKNSFLIFILICLSLLTISRNQLWIDDLSLWQDASKKNIWSGRPWSNLGKAYYEKNELELAKQYFQKSLSMTPQIENSHYNLANVFMDLNRLVDAEKEYKKALEIRPRYEEALLGLGSTYNQTGRYQKAILAYKQAIEIRQLSNLGKNYYMARLKLRGGLRENWPLSRCYPRIKNRSRN